MTNSAQQKEINKNIAMTIASQLGGIRILTSMIGAKNFAFDGPSLQFKFKASNKFNFCKISLNSMDTYDVKLSKVTMKRATCEFVESNIKEFSGVYCDQLMEIFEETTRLYLTL